MRVLVTGGAGYIGSHTVVQLLGRGHEPVIVDNFQNSKPSVIDRIAAITGTRVPVHRCDLRDAAQIRQVFEAEHFDAVIHFAGLKAVADSTRRPLAYYDTNVTGTLNLLAAMVDHGVGTLVFSSSATVYGSQSPSPLTEDLPVSASNPYGWTKITVERILRDLGAARPAWRVALLRYFNPVGAHPSGLIGEDPSGPPDNLMPVISQVAVGRLPRLQIYGADYDTVDGTGVRDYIHVEDLAAGHLAALDHLGHTDSAVGTWNLGTGRGTSVLELVRAFGAASGRTIPYDLVDRRPGDIATCFADPTRAKAELGWSAVRTIEDMCADTWRWQERNPDGYPLPNGVATGRG